MRKDPRLGSSVRCIPSSAFLRMCAVTPFPSLPFLPAGLRTVGVVGVVVVGGEKVDDQLLYLLFSCSILNFSSGGIRGTLTRFLFGVGSMIQKSDFFSGG